MLSQQYQHSRGCRRFPQAVMSSRLPVLGGNLSNMTPTQCCKRQAARPRPSLGNRLRGQRTARAHSLAGSETSNGLGRPDSAKTPDLSCGSDIAVTGLTSSQDSLTWSCTRLPTVSRVPRKVHGGCFCFACIQAVSFAKWTAASVSFAAARFHCKPGKR